MKKINVTYKEVEELVNKIVEQIKEEKIIVNKIVAISRGGLVPARLLATKLDVRYIYSIGITLYDDNNKATEPKIYQELPKFSADDNIIIIDDVVESSVSMKIAERHARVKGAKNIFTASIHVKEDHGIMPDFFGKMMDKDEWIIYDWES